MPSKAFVVDLVSLMTRYIQTHKVAVVANLHIMEESTNVLDLDLCSLSAFLVK